MSDEYGWLVELQGGLQPHWWAIENMSFWTTDSTRALRFSRKADAEAYIAERGLARAIATDHIWTTLSPAIGDLPEEKP